MKLKTSTPIYEYETFTQSYKSPLSNIKSVRFQLYVISLDALVLNELGNISQCNLTTAFIVLFPLAVFTLKYHYYCVTMQQRNNAGCFLAPFDTFNRLIRVMIFQV